MNDAEKFINKITDEYIEKHTKEQETEDLIGEINRIEQDISGYHGREIFELLQNADDAYQKSIDQGEKPIDELEVNITYTNDVLTVSNTGTFFDKDGIRAIVQGNNSPKSDNDIGEKGTGFRSLLNWATKIIIHSGEYHVEFSEEIAQRKFDEIKNEPQIKKQLEKQLKRNTTLYIPMLAVPEYIANCATSDKTSIEVTIDTHKNCDNFSVVKQLKEIDIYILLFLPNIRKIQVNIDDEKIIYQKINENDNNKVRLKKIINNNCQIEEFFLYKKDKLVIAVPVDFDTFKATHLYSFFPLLDTSSPFNCILHANYELGPDRNTINSNDDNKKIIIEQLNFLIEIAKDLIENKDFERAYKILLPKVSGELFSKFKVKNDYFNNLSSSKIFLTVNNGLFSVNDKPLILEEEYPSVFIGEHFSRLLKPFKKEEKEEQLLEEGKQLLKALCEHNNISTEYEEEDLLKAINASSENWDIQTQVEVFVWWNNNYEMSLPNLIKKHNGEFLKYKEECYFREGNLINVELPNWITIPAIQASYQEELFNTVEKFDWFKQENNENSSISRLIVQNRIFNCVNFKYRDISSIIDTVNSSVDSFFKAIDFVKWLWTHYVNNKSLRSTKKDLNFPCIIDGEKSFSCCKNIFYGKDYGNELGEKLFCSANSSVFPDKHYFDITSDNEEHFIDFIKDLGVKQYPVIELQEIDNRSIYFSYSQIYKKRIRSDKSFYLVNCNLLLINNLREILNTVSTKSIIKWIACDRNLFIHLSNPYESQEATITYNYYGKHYRKVPIHYNGEIENFILEIFNDTKWIKLDEKRFSPREILSYSNNNKKFIGFAPVILSSEKDIDQSPIDDIEIINIEKLAKDIEEKSEKIEEVLNLFDFKKQVTDLPSDKFYEILLNISNPNIDKKRAGELCKAIYRIIEQASFTKKYEDSENKKRFFKEGKMLVTFQGKEQFYWAYQSFLPSSTIIDKKNYHIVVKGARTNNDNFIPVFGCQEYKKDYKIDINLIKKSEANSVFQADFNEFKKYTEAFGNRNANIAKYNKGLKITLASEISLIKNDKLFTVEDEYSFVNNSSMQWYIKVTSSDYNNNQLGIIIKTIYEHIANTPGFDVARLETLFISDKEGRERIIIDEFGSLDVIEDNDFAKLIEKNFLETVKKIDLFYNTETINLDYFDFTEDNFENSKKIIIILQSLNIDIEQFYEDGFKETVINLVPYFRKQLKDFIRDNEDTYKNMLYAQAVNNEELQKSFFDDIDEFRNFEKNAIITNSVNFSIIDTIKENFPAWTDDKLSIDINKIYQDNYKNINQQDCYSDDIVNNDDVKRMIYFNKKDEFENWKKKKEIEEKTDLLNNSKEADPYSKYRNTIPQKCENEYSDRLTQSEKNSKQIFSSPHVYTKKEDKKRRLKQKKQGNIGELVIYNYLCKEYGKDNVFPKSEAFVELGELASGQAEACGFDIMYKDKNGVQYYAEVKTGHDNTFYITPHELDFARENKEQYKLFYVYDLDSEPPNFKELPFKFWEDTLHYSCEEIIECIKVKF